MGGGAGPGSGGRRDGGQPQSDLEALDQYGVGEKNPVTGLYENYDIPEGHAANRVDEGGTPVEWETLIGQWPLIVADFASEYGVRLPGSSMRWPEFQWLLHGLFAADTRISRFFRPPDPDTPTEEG